MTLAATCFSQNKAVLAEAHKMVKDGEGAVVCYVVSNDDTPLEYATVTVLKPEDSTMIAGGITDEQGYAIIAPVPYGTYMVKIGYIGYKSLYINNISISKEQAVVTTGKQKINTSTKTLKGVTVNAEREMLQSNLDKRVFNVDKSIVTEGSTGVDILENIPSVSVDLDGNVSLRGSSSVTILVDGRPTNLTMDEIPADMIESVEVVTNPSARYEPDGTSGIINVVLKKKKTLGFNISASIGAGMSDDKKNVYFGKYNASLNLNFRVKKVNFFLSYSFRSFSFTNHSTMNRMNVFNNDTSFLNQKSEYIMNGRPQNVRAGIDYFINDNNTLSFEFGYRRRMHYHINDITSLTTGKNNSFYNQHSYNPKLPTHNYNASINYRYTSPTVKGRELTIDMFFSDNNRYDQNIVEKNYIIPPYDYYQSTITDNNGRIFNAQIDFVTPIGNGGRLETGYKLSYKLTRETYTYYIGEDSSLLIEQTDRNDASKYTDIINAAYLIYSNSIKNVFKYQVGVRAELAKNISELQSSSDVFSPAPYFNLFPTIHLRYDFNPMHSMQLSYSMRVRRPRGHELDPFLNDIDPLNLRQGNRELKPELTHSFDLGYLLTYKKMSLSANVFYRFRTKIISRYTILINDSTTFTTYANLNNSHSFGLEIAYQQELWKVWRLSLNANLFQTYVNADSLYDKSLRNDFSWRLRWNNTFTLPLDFQIQLTADYRSPSLTLNSMGFESGGAGQGRMSATWSIDFGIKKSFFKKTFSIALNVNDLFNTRQTYVESYGSTSNSYYESKMRHQRDSRRVYLTLTYNLSNYKVKRRNNSGENSDYDDMEE